MLYSGKQGANCVLFAPNVASPTTVILNDVSIDPSCKPIEFDAFAPGLGAYGRVVDGSNANDSDWLTQAILSGTLAISLPSPHRVPLKIWIVATGSTDIGKAEAMRDRLLDKAYPVLATLGTGLTLDTASAPLNPALVPPRCDAAGSISSNSAIYDASRINVYFVKDYRNIPDLTPAYNCWQPPVNHPEIMFISWGNTNVVDPTLLHELGHALGLIHPTSIGGHTNFTSGFNPYNYMASNVDITNASIGQLYAMNFSSDSWLNRPGGTPMSVVRTCADSWDGGDCPSLKMFQPGWPP